MRVEHIDTSTNRADLLTKPLKREVFAKHRSGLMNLTDVSAAPPAEVVAVVAPPTSLLLVNPNQRSSTLQRTYGRLAAAGTTPCECVRCATVHTAASADVATGFYSHA